MNQFLSFFFSGYSVLCLSVCLSLIYSFLHFYITYQIGISGKDQSCLFILFFSSIPRKYPNLDLKLQALYIRSRCRFPEVEKFVQLSRDRHVTPSQPYLVYPAAELKENPCTVYGFYTHEVILGMKHFEHLFSGLYFAIN